jgi:hypothetical protein
VAFDTIDIRLYKKALKQLRGFPSAKKDQQVRNGGGTPDVDKHLAKFYVKNKSVYVIMEVCNDDAQIHFAIHNFVLNTVRWSLLYLIMVCVPYRYSIRWEATTGSDWRPSARVIRQTRFFSLSRRSSTPV